MQIIRRNRFDQIDDSSVLYDVALSVVADEPVTIDDERDVHDLLWSETAPLQVQAAGLGAVHLAAGHAVWVPAGVSCLIVPTDRTALRSLAFWTPTCPLRWVSPTTVDTTPLTRELCALLCAAPRPTPRRYYAERLLLATLQPTSRTAIALPADDRARRVADALLADPADRRTLEQWGHAVGASARTLARLFRAETGMTFPRW
ncbi:MAG: AraC family transcriptional regulator [Ilumatobacteraceae bacterium]